MGARKTTGPTFPSNFGISIWQHILHDMYMNGIITGYMLLYGSVLLVIISILLPRQPMARIFLGYQLSTPYFRMLVLHPDSSWLRFIRHIIPFVHYKRYKSTTLSPAPGIRSSSARPFSAMAKIRVLAAVISAVIFPLVDAVSSQAYTWRNVKIGGGGGFIPGIVFNPSQKVPLKLSSELKGTKFMSISV